MSKKFLTLVFASCMIVSLCSCDGIGAEYSGSGTITFYDGTTKLGSLTGKAADPISSDDKSTLASYEVKTDYIFYSWYSDSSYKSKVAINFYPYKNLDVFAKFLTDVTISLDAGDGTFADGADTSFTGLQETEIVDDFPIPTKTNSSFSYWYYLDDTNEEVKFDTKFYPTEDLTLYAKYSDWPYLSFVTNVAGYEIDPIQVEPGSSVPGDIINNGKLNARDDYRFDGWYTDETFSKLFNFASMPEEDTTIYAKFVQRHSIFFVTNVAGYSIDPLVNFTGEKISAPDIDKDQMKLPNKHFDGWYEDSSLAGEQYNFDKMPESDLTLYAKWTDNPVLTLYDIDRTTVLATISSNEPGDKIDLTSHNPVHEHQTFLKWVETIGSTSNDVVDPQNYVVPNVNASLYIEYRPDYLLTINFEDVEGNIVAGIDSYTEIWGSINISDPTNDVESYLDSNTSIDYKVLSFHDSANKDNLFPYTIASAQTITAVIARKTTISLEDQLGNAIGSVSGYQTEPVVNDNSTQIDPVSHNYIIYDFTTDYSSDDYSIKFIHIKGDDTIEYSLVDHFPLSDITYVVVFVPLEVQ